MSNHTREAEINQRFDSIESKLAALEKLIKSNPVSEAPASLQTAITCDTPINTIVVYSNERLFFKGIHGGDAKVSHDILSDDYFRVNIETLSIDITADLKFRLFLNAPADCKWGAIDYDGAGYVFTGKPSFDDEGWVGAGGFCTGGFCTAVGMFPQYAHISDKTLVER